MGQRYRRCALATALALAVAGVALADPPTTDGPVALDLSGEALSSAELTWQALAARVPDLSAHGLRTRRPPANRVPRASEITTRRSCSYVRDTQSSIMRRRCYTDYELTQLQRQAQIYSPTIVGGRRQ